LLSFFGRFLVGAATIVALSGAFGIDQEEFGCEQAAAHLADCCPGFDAHSLYCYKGGCGSRSVDLAQDQSDCIIGATCDQLQSSGACKAPMRVTCK
jgi:hypothetical protein